MVVLALIILVLFLAVFFVASPRGVWANVSSVVIGAIVGWAIVTVFGWLNGG